MVQSGQTRQASVAQLRAGLARAVNPTFSGLACFGSRSVAMAGETLLLSPAAATATGASVKLAVASSGHGDGSPNMAYLGVDGPALGGVAFLDTGYFGVAARTPLELRVSGVAIAKFLPAQVTVAGNILPMADGTHHLGAPAARWDDVYAINAAIQTSDARSKSDVADCTLGIDFIKALRPVQYRLADIDDPGEVARRTVERVKTVRRVRVGEEIRKVEGQYRVFPVEETVEEAVLRYEPLFDSEGRPLLDDEGRQRLHPVPETETLEVEEVMRPACVKQHRRPHYGLIAQEVKAVLDRLGMDMAGYVYEPDADRHGLRYGEFIAPLIRALQELAGRVETLENSTAGG
ncbi:tail fiber domain-containing protein [Azospirillum brasilense]|uniref:tail fiber domain-containing protein n=1 Tax=Azospirillum brasilense TaxID=192 RepID=UPI001EDC5A01|nr:tail fiber domain-containing protein [Azospirillum brasilense]UKJ78069.1 tail fiber domain-containing protein [Azospirillum brasilense]